jgi:hypothetical protein
MSPGGEFACRFGTYVTRLTVWARWSAGIAAGGGLGWAGGCCVRGRRRTIAIVAEWWSIEVLHGEVSAFRWQEQHDSALIEAALTNGVRDGTWHADRWGVVFEVLFDTEDRWEAFRGLPVVRAALDAVPDPVNGLLIYRGRGGGRYQGAAQAEARAGFGCRFAARARGRAVSGSGGWLRTGRPADDGRGVTAAAGYVPSRAWPR